MNEPATPTFSIAALFRYAISRTTQSAVAWSFLATSLRLLGGLLVLPLVVRKLPSDHLGLWYVFLSLQGIAALFDLGFSPAVTRAAGYLWGGAQQLRKFGVAHLEPSDQANPNPNYPLLTSLVATMRLYYRFFGIGSGLIMLVVGGGWIWIKTQNFPDATSLRACYAVFVFGGFLNATGDLWPALLSGINGVRAAQKILLGSALISLVTTVGGLLAHLGIWSLVIATVGGGAFIRWAGRAAFFQLATVKLDRQANPNFDLIRTLWPTAWRSGLVSLGAFFVVSANTLICSAFLDLKQTASYGLSITLITTLSSVSSTFAQIKLPLINQFRAIAQTDSILEIWIQRTRITLFCYFLGALCILLFANQALQMIGSATALLSAPQLAFALLIFGLDMHHSLYGALVISENENPFVLPSLITGIAIALSSLFLTPWIGIWGLLLSQGLTEAAFNNWWMVHRGIRSLGIPWQKYWVRYIRTPVHI
jgi:O-antigen/teichoic acid export membrane protein